MLSLVVMMTLSHSGVLLSLQNYSTDDYVVVLEACPFCNSAECDGSCQKSNDPVMVEE